jgi:hypothetical protein
MVSEKRGDFLLDETGEGEGEIIELVEVVGEPEPRMSIENFVPSEKEKSFGEMTPPESWEKLEFEEKPEKKELPLRPEKEIGEIDFQFERKMPSKEASPEEELFEKIELEEILGKVEQLGPALEQEWPSEKEVRYVEERPFKGEESSEKYLDFPKFEAPAQKKVKIALPEEEPWPVFTGEPKKKISEEAIPIEESVEEEAFQPLIVEEPKKKISEEAVSIEELVEEEELRELPEEEFLEEHLEDMLKEEEIGGMEEPKKARPKEVEIEELVEEEELRDLPEEGFLEELLEEMLKEEEIGGIEEPKKVRPKEVEIEEIQLQELEAPKIFGEEIKPLVSEVSRKMMEESPLAKVVDKHLEEVISKGIQDMVGDFITRILPLMTQQIIGLTAERIERMVKEIVPALAEKAIQEEIKRLQKGEKE